MLWEWALLIFLSQAVLVFLLCLWAAFFLVVLVPRLRPEEKAPAVAKVRVQPARFVLGGCNKSWEELRAWVKAQPSKTLYKSDVEGMMVGLEQEHEKPGDAQAQETQVVDWGGVK